MTTASLSTEVTKWINRRFSAGWISFTSAVVHIRKVRPVALLTVELDAFFLILFRNVQQTKWKSLPSSVQKAIIHTLASDHLNYTYMHTILADSIHVFHGELQKATDLDPWGTLFGRNFIGTGQPTAKGWDIRGLSGHLLKNVFKQIHMSYQRWDESYLKPNHSITVKLARNRWK